MLYYFNYETIYTKFINLNSMESIQYEIQDRIKEVMAVFYKGNGSEFCRDNDLSQGSMANVVAGRRSNPSFETVKKILSNEENRISADWLILGIGEMQRGSVVSEDVNELRKKLLAKMEELDNIRTELFELKMELLGDVHNKPDEDNIRKDAV